MKCHQIDRDAYRAFSRGILAIPLAALSLLGLSPAAAGADWEALPKITAGAYWNDNYTLAPDDVGPVEVQGAQVRAELELLAKTPLTEFSLKPAVESTFFPDDEEWESNDYYLRLDWKHQRQRFMAGLRVDYSDETTVKSELPSSQDEGGLGEPNDGDGGIVAVDNKRQKVVVLPRLSFVLTERTTLLADAGYANADFDKESLTGTSGYEDISGAIGVAFTSSPTSTISARAIASHYERSVDGAETDSVGAHVDWTSRLSDITQWYVRVGAESVDVPTGGSEPAFEGGIGADWTFQVTRLFVDATATVEPNASGRIIQRNQLRLRLLRQFGPRTNGWIGARYQVDDTLGEAGGAFRDRTYATGMLGLEWRFTRDFSLLGQYDYRWQEFEDDPADRTGNAFQLSLVYQWRRTD